MMINEPEWQDANRKKYLGIVEPLLILSPEGFSKVG